MNFNRRLVRFFLDNHQRDTDNTNMNWIELISKISAAGYTQTAIAEHCKNAQTTISEISRGVIKSPSYETGAALIALYNSLYPEEKV